MCKICYSSLENAGAGARALKISEKRTGVCGQKLKGTAVRVAENLL